jgi:hypothetical protein
VWPKMGHLDGMRRGRRLWAFDGRYISRKAATGYWRSGARPAYL